MLTVCRSFEGSPSGISRNENNNNNNDKNNKNTKERRNVSSCKRLGERDICSNNQKRAGEETLAGWQDLKEAKVDNLWCAVPAVYQVTNIVIWNRLVRS